MKKTNPDGSYSKYCIMDGRVVGGIIYKKTANGVKWSHGMRYIYGDDGSMVGFGIWDADTVNEWERYYFVKNLQGDVRKVYREADNKLVASFDYDPFGKVISATGDMADQIPFRYRGYYYDTETGFYYLNSRYYDPQTCRFINADNFVSTGQSFAGYNMFAYCNNNPQMFRDTVGNMAESCFRADLDKDAVLKLPSVYCQQVGMINGQAEYEWSSSNLGISTYSNSGCGVIAVYNAMQLLGQREALGDIGDEFFCIHGTIGLGLGGVGPWSIASYLRWHNIDSTGSFSCKKLTENVAEGDIFIVTSMNSTKNIFAGFHTVTAQYVDGQYVVYNESSSYMSATPHATLQEAYEGGMWIYGYRIKISE